MAYCRQAWRERPLCGGALSAIAGDDRLAWPCPSEPQAGPNVEEKSRRQAWSCPGSDVGIVARLIRAPVISDMLGDISAWHRPIISEMAPGNVALLRPGLRPCCARPSTGPELASGGEPRSDRKTYRPEIARQLTQQATGLDSLSIDQDVQINIMVSHRYSKSGRRRGRPYHGLDHSHGYRGGMERRLWA